MTKKENESFERKVVIPGEVIISGEEYLPGEWTEKKDDEIIAIKFGLAEETDKLVKVIPFSGGYYPRRGNVVIGRVEMLTHNGWVIDIGNSENAFLSLMEFPKFIQKGSLHEVMNIGDMVVAKVAFTKGRGVELTLKSSGVGKIEGGIVFKLNPNKVPRIIGKEGSMIKLIKDETGCNITIGQNGFIWIQNEKIENELLAKKAIMFISEKFFTKGLTESVEKFFKEEKKENKND